MRIEPFLRESTCLVLRDTGDQASVFAAVARAAADALGRPDSAGDILAGLTSRETVMPTTTPEGVAFPHTHVPGAGETVLILVSLTPPIRFRPTDTAPIRFVACMVGNRDKPFEHVRLLARLARILRAPDARERLALAEDARALLGVAIAEDRALG